MKSYLGTGWAFPPSFVKDKGVEMVSEEEDIRQSLVILFSTSAGERMMRFDYGTYIRQWVFDEMSLSVKTLIIDSLKQSILMYEPRIRVDNIDIEIKDDKEGILWITIDYYVLATNNRANMVYPFYFKEGTNI